MERMGYDNQMRGIQTIEQVHVQPGDGWRGWGTMIRQGVFNQLTSSRTPWRWMKRMG